MTINALNSSRQVYKTNFANPTKNNTPKYSGNSLKSRQHNTSPAFNGFLTNLGKKGDDVLAKMKDNTQEVVNDLGKKFEETAKKMQEWGKEQNPRNKVEDNIKKSEENVDLNK